jgi:hypothetical protein
MFNVNYGSRTCTKGTLHLRSIKWKWVIFTFRTLFKQKKSFYPSGRRVGEGWKWWRTEQSLALTQLSGQYETKLPLCLRTMQCRHTERIFHLLRSRHGKYRGGFTTYEACLHREFTVCPLPMNLPYFIEGPRSDNLQLLIRLRIY